MLAGHLYSEIGESVWCGRGIVLNHVNGASDFHLIHFILLTIVDEQHLTAIEENVSDVAYIPHKFHMAVKSAQVIQAVVARLNKYILVIAYKH